MNSFNNDMAWEREKSLSINMPGLMKDIYLWVAIALAITGFTAYTVAGSPMLLSLSSPANSRCGRSSSRRSPSYGTFLLRLPACLSKKRRPCTSSMPS